MADEKTPAAAPKGAAAAPAAAPRKKAWKSVSFAKVHVQCSFNNTIVTLTDDRGDVLAWATAGGSGFRGTKKGTPFAAGITSSKVAKKAAEMGVKQCAVFGGAVPSSKDKAAPTSRSRVAPGYFFALRAKK